MKLDKIVAIALAATVMGCAGNKQTTHYAAPTVSQYCQVEPPFFQKTVPPPRRTIQENKSQARDLRELEQMVKSYRTNVITQQKEYEQLEHDFLALQTRVKERDYKDIVPETRRIAQRLEKCSAPDAPILLHYVKQYTFNVEVVKAPEYRMEKPKLFSGNVPMIPFELAFGIIGCVLGMPAPNGKRVIEKPGYTKVVEIHPYSASSRVVECK